MFCYDPAISLTISLRLQINIGKIIMVKRERRALKVKKAKRDVDYYRILMYNEGTRIAQKLVESKAANGGRVPYGYFTELLDGGKECFPKLSRRTINNHVTRIEKGLPADEDISMDFNLGYIMPNNSETSDKPKLLRYFQIGRSFWKQNVDPEPP